MCRLVNVIFLHTKRGNFNFVHLENRKEIHFDSSVFITPCKRSLGQSNVFTETTPPPPHRTETHSPTQTTRTETIPTPPPATSVGGMHPSGMYSCYYCSLFFDGCREDLSLTIYNLLKPKVKYFQVCCFKFNQRFFFTLFDLLTLYLLLSPVQGYYSFTLRSTSGTEHDMVWYCMQCTFGSTWSIKHLSTTFVTYFWRVKRYLLSTYWLMKVKYRLAHEPISVDFSDVEFILIWLKGICNFEFCAINWHKGANFILLIQFYVVPPLKGKVTSLPHPKKLADLTSYMLATMNSGLDSGSLVWLKWISHFLDLCKFYLIHLGLGKFGLIHITYAG